MAKIFPDNRISVAVISSVLENDKADKRETVSYDTGQGRRGSVSVAKTSPESTTVVVVDEKPKISIWRNRKLLTVAVAVMIYNTATGVSDQQISKAVNSASFSAPFFLLWYMGVVRTFVSFPVYVTLRAVFDCIRNNKTSFDLVEAHHLTPVTVIKMFFTAVRSIYRDAEQIFGPNGLTLKAAAKYLVPFALLWTSTNGLFYWAVTFTEVSECVAVSSSTMIFIHVISLIFLKEKFILFKFVGVAICMAGVVLTVLASGTSIGASNDSLIAAGLVLASSLSLALQTVGFKRYLGSPTLCQIALFQSLSAFTNMILTWPIFLTLRLTEKEMWNFDTAPFGLLSFTAVLGSTGAFSYYIGVSVVSPVFISLSKPLQIVANNGVDIGIKGVTFGLYHVIGAGLVIIGFLMLLVPNTLVSLDIRALVVKVRPGNKPSVLEVDLHTTASPTGTAELKIDREIQLT